MDYHGNQTIHVVVVFIVNFPLSKEVLKFIIILD